MFSRYALALSLSLGLASAANAVIPSYPSPGIINAMDYTFTAASNGTVVAYFLGGNTIRYESELGLRVNGIDVGTFGLNNKTSALGDSFDFGGVLVNAGDELVFRLSVLSTGNEFFSKRSLNPDGITHIYSTAYGGGDYGVPAGTYVAFEDVLLGGTYEDFDYNDLEFAFTNVRGQEVPGIPEPASWALMIAGFGMVGLASRRRHALTA